MDMQVSIRVVGEGCRTCPHMVIRDVQTAVKRGSGTQVEHELECKNFDLCLTAIQNSLEGYSGRMKESEEVYNPSSNAIERTPIKTDGNGNYIGNYPPQIIPDMRGNIFK